MSQETLDLIQMMLPLIVVQYGLAFYCVFLIWKKGVQNLNRGIWTLIVLIVNLLGPLAFLIFGRKRY